MIEFLEKKFGLKSDLKSKIRAFNLFYLNLNSNFKMRDILLIKIEVNLHGCISCNRVLFEYNKTQKDAVTQFQCEK